MLVLGTLAAYLPLLRDHAAFVNFDDDVYVTQNHHIQAGLSWNGLVWALTSVEASNWHPLTWLSLEADGSLYGQAAFGYHLGNVLWHTATTLLLFLCLLGMTGAASPSALIAALFALHPVHVESVAWVAERKDVLSAFFFCLSIAAYVNYTRRRAVPWSLLLLLSFMLGLSAKPMLVTLPAILLLLDFWPLHRMSRVSSVASKNGMAADSRSGVVAWTQVRKLIWEKVPLIILAVLSSAITWYAQQHGGALRSLEKVPLDARIPNALIAYVGYIREMFWPCGLAAFYPFQHLSWTQPAVFAAAAFLLAISLIAIRQARRRPYLVVGWAWFVVMLLPVIGLVQVGEQSMADRYTYLPLIGLFLLAVWSVRDVCRAWRLPVLLPVVGSLVLLTVCWTMTAVQLSYWRDSLTLWQHTLACTAPSAVAHNNMGSALLTGGREAEAEQHFRDAISINPHFSDAHANLGSVLEHSGRLPEAFRHYRRAVELDPKNADAQYNLGAALARQNQTDEAITHFRLALQHRPHFAAAHNNLGTAYMHQAQFASAIQEFLIALSIKPDYAIARQNLAAALRTTNDRAWVEATSPNSRVRNPAEALELATLLCQTTDSSNADYLDTLAAAYAATGDFANASAIAHRALDLAAGTEDHQRIKEIQARLALYDGKQAFVDDPGKSRK